MRILAQAVALLAFAVAAPAQEMKACSVLEARYTVAQVEGRQPQALDTGRIQAALRMCSPGRAVVLRSTRSAIAFVSAPLILPREVTLWIADATILYASRNPRDYDLAAASCGPAEKGPAEAAPAVCKPFLYAYQAAFSGVEGPGIVDGQGAGWWRAAGGVSPAPDLVSSYESQGFHVGAITLRNAPGVPLAIFKTTALRLSGSVISALGNAPPSPGILLSNVVDAGISGLSVRVPGPALALQASILGGTSGVIVDGLKIQGGSGIAIGDDVYGSVHDVSFDHVDIVGASHGVSFNRKGVVGGEARQIHFRSGCLFRVAEPFADLPADREIDFDPHAWQVGATDCVSPAGDRNPAPAPSLDVSSPARLARGLTVGPDGFHSVQEAVDALPATGGEITVKPGVYREVVTIRKPHVHLHGEGDPAETVIVFNHGPSYGGTFASATVFVEADDATLDHLTVANDLGAGKGQAVALSVTSDRAIFRQLRILGAQDTLFAASRYCYGDYGPCVPARQYFADSYIEGNTDFIFGDGMVVFERCELHGIASGNVMYTAQSRHTAAQRESGYVFDHCRLTGAARREPITLGRPWRPYATVVFLETEMEAPVIAAGWTEWVRFGKPSLPTAYYAEFHSTGPGANPQGREPYSHQLTAAEVEQWRANRFLAGADGFHPSEK